jgi:hypothetical protein
LLVPAEGLPFKLSKHSRGSRTLAHNPCWRKAYIVGPLPSTLVRTSAVGPQHKFRSFFALPSLQIFCRCPVSSLRRLRTEGEREVRYVLMLCQFIFSQRWITPFIRFVTKPFVGRRTSHSGLSNCIFKKHKNGLYQNWKLIQRKKQKRTKIAKTNTKRQRRHVHS